MAVKINDAISYFENLYRNKGIYLWGANTEVITKELCDRLYKSYGSSTYNKAYYDNKLKEGAGHLGADCSGALYPMSTFDTTAQGYYNKCSSKGSISGINRNKACLVFKGKSASAINHVGFYLGNGYVVEMKSSKDNCVRNTLDGNGWQWFGIPTWIDYSSATSTSKESFVKCVDVSSYQGDIDWNLVKSSGINYAILKVIRKDLTPDTKFEQNWNGCQVANVLVTGVYNYSYATTVAKAKSDAQKVLSILNGRKCTVWFDVEDKCQQGLGKTLIDIINAYGDVITSAGYDFGVYSGMDFTKNYIKPYLSYLKYKKLWIARYYNGYNKMAISVDPNEQYNPKNSIGMDIYGWQYTSSGQVPGITGNVDLSVIYGSIQQPSSSTVTPVNTITETTITMLGKINTNSSNLNIRLKPESSSTSTILGSYKKGEVVQLLARTSNGWYRTDKGYISGDYVSSATGKVSNCFKLNMRKEPKVEKGNEIKILLVGAELYLLKDAGDWYKVQTKDNVVGYVSKKYVTVL